MKPQPTEAVEGKSSTRQKGVARPTAGTKSTKSAKAKREIVIFYGVDPGAVEAEYQRALEAGLAAPRPTEVGTLQTLEAWQDRLLFGVDDSDDAINPGRPWQFAASEIFLANWNQPRWGWIARGLDRLHAFWMGFDETVKVVLVRSDLRSFLARQLQSLESSADFEERVAAWEQFEQFAATLQSEHAGRVSVVEATGTPSTVESALGNVLVALLIQARSAPAAPADAALPPLAALGRAIEELCELQSAKGRFQQAEAELQRLQASSQSATEALKASTTECQQLGAELSARSEVLRRTSLERAELAKQQDGLRAALADAKAEVDKLRAQPLAVQPVPTPVQAVAATVVSGAATLEHVKALECDLELTRLHLFEAQSELALLATGPASAPAAPAVQPPSAPAAVPPVEPPSPVSSAAAPPAAAPPAAAPTVVAQREVAPPATPAAADPAPGVPSIGSTGFCSNKLVVQPIKPNSEYEALDIFCSQATFRTYQWPTFAFRIGAAALIPDGFSSNPRIEVSRQGPAKPFESWHPETETELGATFELRMETRHKALDLDVWRALAKDDQALMTALLRVARTAVEAASAWPKKARPKADWLGLIDDMIATLRARVLDEGLLAVLE